MDSLEAIYPRYRDFVFRICSRYARTRDDAEDLTQETFLKVADRLQGFRQESELGTWLYRVAVNKCLDYLRAVRSREKYEQIYLDDMVEKNLAHDGNRILARLTLDRILGKFRPILRQTLFLTLAEGLSYSEAAAVLGISTATVSKSVNRFLKKTGSAGFLLDQDENPPEKGKTSRNAPPAPSNSAVRERTHG